MCFNTLEPHIKGTPEPAAKFTVPPDPHLHSLQDNFVIVFDDLYKPTGEDQINIYKVFHFISKSSVCVNIKGAPVLAKTHYSI